MDIDNVVQRAREQQRQGRAARALPAAAHGARGGGQQSSAEAAGQQWGRRGGGHGGQNRRVHWLRRGRLQPGKFVGSLVRWFVRLFVD